MGGKGEKRSTLQEVFTAARTPYRPEEGEGQVGLKPLELRLWLVVRGFDGGRGCFASTATLSDVLGCSVSSVEKLRARLSRVGWIQVTHRGPQEPVLRAVIPPEALQADEEQGVRGDEKHGSGALQQAEEQEPQEPPEALQQNEEHEVTSSSPSSSPSSSLECKQNTGNTGNTITTPPQPPHDGGTGEEEEKEDDPSPPPFPSALFVDVTHEVLWLSDRPPRGAPDRWDVAADLRAARQRWAGLVEGGAAPEAATEEVEAFVRGARLRADRAELRERGLDGVPRAIEAETGFTWALLNRRLEADPRFWHETVHAWRKKNGGASEAELRVLEEVLGGA